MRESWPDVLLQGPKRPYESPSASLSFAAFDLCRLSRHPLFRIRYSWLHPGKIACGSNCVLEIKVRNFLRGQKTPLVWKIPGVWCFIFGISCVVEFKIRNPVPRFLASTSYHRRCGSYKAHGVGRLWAMCRNLYSLNHNHSIPESRGFPKVRFEPEVHIAEPVSLPLRPGGESVS